MRLPVETEERTEVLQEEIISLAEDIIDINDKLDEVVDIEDWVVNWCIKLCDIVRRTNEKVDSVNENIHVVNDRLCNHMEDFDDKVLVSKIVIAIFVICFIVWNFILTYYIVNGIQ